MTKIARLLPWLFVVVLGGAGIMIMLFPTDVTEAAGFGATSDYGITNLRTLGAPTLALAVATAIGVLRNDWLLLLPASMYFLFNASARVISVVSEGYNSEMLAGLMITFGLFAASVLAIKAFRAKPLVNDQ